MDIQIVLKYLFECGVHVPNNSVQKGLKTKLAFSTIFCSYNQFNRALSLKYLLRFKKKTMFHKKRNDCAKRVVSYIDKFEKESDLRKPN